MPGRINGAAILLRPQPMTELAGRDYAWTPAASGLTILRYPSAAMRVPVFPLRHPDGCCTTIASLDTDLRSKIAAVVNRPSRRCGVYQSTPP